MISTSMDQYNKMVMSGKKEDIIYSFFPSDPWKCECQPILLDLKARFSQMNSGEIQIIKNSMKVVRCPLALKKNKYKIMCTNCKEHVADVAADNSNLDNWCDLHYISTSYIDKNGAGHWKGALSINISPIDGKIGIECCCGADTRDFRANSTLPGKVVKRKIEECSKGREFGNKDSKFKAILTT